MVLKRSILENVSCALEKMYVLLCFSRMFYTSWSDPFSLLFWSSAYLFLPVIESEALKFPTVTVDLSISPFILLFFCVSCILATLLLYTPVYCGYISLMDLILFPL